MVRPYTVVGLIPTVRGIRKRDDIAINLGHIAHMVKAAAWLSSLELPVRLIALPEGALQGFNDARMRHRYSRSRNRLTGRHRKAVQHFHHRAS